MNDSCPLEKAFERIKDSDHFDEKNYGRTQFNGFAFPENVESSLTMDYVLGNAFIGGMLGDMKVRIYYRAHSGAQVFFENTTTAKFTCLPGALELDRLYRQIRAFIGPNPIDN